MNKFIFFSNQHFIILGVGVVVIFLLLLVANFFDKKEFAKVTAIMILILKIAELFYRHYILGLKVVNLLPLHLCNIVLIFILIMMITSSKTLFQFCYYWSIGAIFALATPDVKYDIHDFATISFFITHFYIIFAVIYRYIYFSEKPTLKGYFSAFILLNVIALIVFFINKKLGTNYLFVNRVPDFSSPLSYFGKWPNYILVVEFIDIILTYLIYFPFREKSVKYKKEIFY